MNRESAAVKHALSTTGSEASHARIKLLQSAAHHKNETGAMVTLKPLLSGLLGVPKGEVAGLIKDASDSRNEASRSNRKRHRAGQSGVTSTNHKRKGEPIGDATDADSDLVDQFGDPVYFRGDTAQIASVSERFFAAHYHQKVSILYEPAKRGFYRYDEQTGTWRHETDDMIREGVSSSVCHYGRAAGIPIDCKIAVSRMNGIISALCGISEKRAAFQQPRDYVHVKNGVVRFPDGGRVTMVEFSPHDFSRNRSPVDFQKDSDCPNFINDLLNDALPEDDVDLLQRWASLAIACVNPAQRIFILDGGPATGKSTFARIMQLLVGIENTAQLRTALLFERFEIFRFIRKTLLLAPDVPGDFLNRPSAAALKSLVGGDPLTAEGKGSNAVFMLDGKFNVLITANSRLHVRFDGDAGSW